MEVENLWKMEGFRFIALQPNYIQLPRTNYYYYRHHP